MTESIDSTNKLFNQIILSLSLIPHATRWWAHSLLVVVVMAGYICTDSTKPAFAQDEGNSVQCQTTYSEECFSPQEKWAWEQIVQGKPAKMNDYPDDDQDTEPLSQDNKPSCKLLNAGGPIERWPPTRTLSHQFIEFVATHPRYEQGANTRLVHIECAVVDKRINLSNKEIRPQIIIRNSLLKNGINISGAHFLRSFTIENSVTGAVNSAGALFDRSLSLKENRHEQVILDNAQIRANLLVEDSTLTKTFSAQAVDVGGDTYLMRTVFEGLVNLRGAKATGILLAKDSQFNGKFNTYNLDVAGGIFLINATFRKTVTLTEAKTAGILLAKDSQFKGEFKAYNLDAAGGIFLINTAFKKTVTLTEAKTAGRLLANDSQFGGEFEANGLDAAGGILLRNTTFKKTVNLIDAKTAGILLAKDSQFKGKFIAPNLDAAGGIFLAATTFKKIVDLTGAKTDTLKLVGSSFASRLDLRQAHIANSFVLYDAEEANEGKMKASVPLWKKGAKLMLNHAHAGGLHARMPESWLIYDDNSQPTSTLLTRDLHGFTYDSLHLTAGDEIDDKRITSLIEWAGGAMTDHSKKKETLLGSTLNFMRDLTGGESCAALEWQQQGATKYTPQPYIELAGKLRELGAADEADRVLIAKFNHYYETQSWLSIDKPMGKVICYVSNYGVKPFRPFYLFFYLILLLAPLNFFAYKSSYEQSGRSQIARFLLKYVFLPLFRSFGNSIPIPGFPSCTKEAKPDRLRYLLCAQQIIGLILLVFALGYIAI